MSEHPMITAIDTALMFDNVPPHITALQWLSNPENVSELMFEAAIDAMWDDGAPDVIFTVMINTLIKEIEGHE